MNAVRCAGLALACLLATNAGAQTAGRGAAPASTQPGMLVKGDPEAPLVLNIVPWEEMKVPPPPPIVLPPVLPGVMDDARALLEDYERRQGPVLPSGR